MSNPRECFGNICEHGIHYYDSKEESDSKTDSCITERIVLREVLPSDSDKDTRIAELERALEHKDSFYLPRMKRIQELFKPTEYYEKVCTILANGTADAFENPSYAQAINIRDHKILTQNVALDAAEKALGTMANNCCANRVRDLAKTELQKLQKARGRK